MSENDRVDRAIAIFYNPKVNKRTALMPNILGGMYREYLDYDGLFISGVTDDVNLINLGFYEYHCKTGRWIVEKSPPSQYHVWHICYCDKCAEVGGRVKDHSQGTWNDHLRYVPNHRLFTFPVATKG